MQADPAILPSPGDSPMDAYLTDGRRLLRIVSLPDRSRGWRTAVLEDCRTLELRHFSRRHLKRLRPLGSRARGRRGVVADAPAFAEADQARDLETPRSSAVPGSPVLHADARP